MLNLYYKKYCPYCMRVIAANETIKAPLVMRDVLADAATRAELLAKGGRPQVPFLEDTETGAMMYESRDIIDYLQEHYGKGDMPTITTISNVCPID